MAQAEAAVTTCVNVLLCFLTREVHIVSCLVEVGWARHACVPIRDVETAGITCVPVGVMLHQIGIRGRRGLLLPTMSQADESLPSCWWRCKGVACRSHHWEGMPLC